MHNLSMDRSENGPQLELQKASSSSDPTSSLLVLFARCHDLMETTAQEVDSRFEGSTVSGHFVEAWAISSTRFIPLLTQFCDPQVLASFDAELVTIGLVGPELFAKCTLFDTACASRSIPGRVTALRVAGAAIKATASVVGLAEGTDALGDFAFLLADALELASTPNGSSSRPEPHG
jgi:hypothetical protein